MERLWIMISQDTTTPQSIIDRLTNLSIDIDEDDEGLGPSYFIRLNRFLNIIESLLFNLHYEDKTELPRYHKIRNIDTIYQDIDDLVAEGLQMIYEANYEPED
jgi:hypothetical protein